MYDYYDFDMATAAQGLLNMFADLFASFVFGAIIALIAIIAFACLTYFILRHILYTLGQKAGLDNGWMAFVPVARAIYFCKLASSASRTVSTWVTPERWTVAGTSARVNPSFFASSRR